jgi:hypothetical protein
LDILWVPAGGSYYGVPVRTNPAFCGLPPPLSLTATCAVRVPVAEGVKVTLMKQLPAATLVRPGDSAPSLPLLANRRALYLHHPNRRATLFVSLESGLNCLHFPTEPDNLRLLRPDLLLLLVDEGLLFLDRIQH